MPHKKAKRSVREQTRKETSMDLAPERVSLRNEAIPKSASRVFDAQTIREEYKKKRKLVDNQGERPGKRQKTTIESGNGMKKGKVSLTIQPGESMQHFNRRVEDDLRPLVKSAVHASRAVERNAVKEEREARAEAKKAKQSKDQPKSDQKVEKSATSSAPPLPQVDKHAGRPKEFAIASSTAQKRLNDIAQAPPEFKKLPRGASSAIGKKEGVLSMSQKLMMEQEREKAIVRYRELKASRKQTVDQEA